jgi:HEAT repeat protein
MRSISKLAIGTFLAVSATVVAKDANSAPPTVPADQVEFISTPDSIKQAVGANTAPTLIWEALEHGEKLECLDCIPLVSKLIYDANAKTREISTWWLRRRIFGVFGPGEVYEQTLNTLQSDSDPVRRSYAAYALGEFFLAPGIPACANALTSDQDARVRAAAASALGRLNDDGAGALGKAMTDADPTVKLAALHSAGRINAFSGEAAVAALTTDPSGDVRRSAIETLDALRAKDALVAVAAAALNDTDARVRSVACHALGTFGDASETQLLNQIVQNDADQFVRDQAAIALRRL